jgi:hypothetical protein
MIFDSIVQSDSPPPINERCQIKSKLLHAQPAICDMTTHPCPHCGSRMVIIETFEAPRSYPNPPSTPPSTPCINTS